MNMALMTYLVSIIDNVNTCLVIFALTGAIATIGSGIFCVVSKEETGKVPTYAKTLFGIALTICVTCTIARSLSPDSRDLDRILDAMNKQVQTSKNH